MKKTRKMYEHVLCSFLVLFSFKFLPISTLFRLKGVLMVQGQQFSKLLKERKNQQQILKTFSKIQ